MTIEQTTHSRVAGDQAHRIFVNEETDREFARKGYVVLPFLDAEAIQAVQALHDRLFPVVPSDFYSSFVSATTDQRLGVLTGIRKLLAGQLKTILPWHKVQLATFITKRPTSQRGQLALHQDSWITDHRVEAAPSVWCPLVDVGPMNACLRVVPGSHRFFHNPCPMNAYVAKAKHLAYRPEADPLEDEFIKDVPMQAGMALIYDPRLVHGSGENLVDRPRVALNCVTIPEQREPQLYFWDDRPPERMQVFEVTESFLCQFNFLSRPDEPYPEGVRLIDTIDGLTTPPARIDRAALRRLQTDASAEN